MTGYNDYINYINKIIHEKTLGSFKSNSIYNGILEHVSYEYGLQYYELILKEFNIDNNLIFDFTKLNDSIGNPIKYNYNNINCSPSSLRYIYHACLILDYMKTCNLNNINIVEVGGGYGGLCLAINYFSKYFNVSISKYNIIDLPVVIKLISKYLSYFNLEFEIDIHESHTYGCNLPDNLFLISNYCYSEIDTIERNKYKDILIPKIDRGFLIWNTSNLEVIKNNQIIKNEKPETSGYGYNKFIYL